MFRPRRIPVLLLKNKGLVKTNKFDKKKDGNVSFKLLSNLNTDLNSESNGLIKTESS